MQDFDPNISTLAGTRYIHDSTILERINEWLQEIECLPPNQAKIKRFADLVSYCRCYSQELKTFFSGSDEEELFSKIVQKPENIKSITNLRLKFRIYLLFLAYLEVSC